MSETSGSKHVTIQFEAALLRNRPARRKSQRQQHRDGTKQGLSNKLVHASDRSAKAPGVSQHICVSNHCTAFGPCSAHA